MSAALPAVSDTESTWAPPRLSLRFIPVWRRNFLVWRKLFVERLLTNVVEPLLTIVAFGYGLGSLLPQIDGVNYLQFLATGSIAMSVMYSAKFEALWGAFSRMHVQKTWDAILHTPLSVDDLLARRDRVGCEQGDLHRLLHSGDDLGCSTSRASRFRCWCCRWRSSSRWCSRRWP